MPELPDVVVYLECLAPRIAGQPLERVRLGSPFFLRSVEPPVAAAVPADLAEIAWDPQTSGGLLAAVPAATAPRLLDAFGAAGVRAATIGAVEARSSGAWVALG